MLDLSKTVQLRIKTWIIIAVSLSVLLLTSILVINWYLQTYLTPSYFENMLQSATGQSVRIGSVEGGLFDGVLLQEVIVRTDNGSDEKDFFRAKSIHVQLKYLPLLLGQTWIGQLHVKKPVINLRRSRAGDWESPFKINADSTRDVIEEEFAAKVDDPFIEVKFRIDELLVTNGTLIVDDRQEQRTWTVALDSVSIRDLTSDLSGEIHFHDVHRNSTTLGGSLLFQAEPFRFKSSNLTIRKLPVADLRDLPINYLEQHHRSAFPGVENAQVTTRFDTLLLSGERTDLGGEFELTGLHFRGIKYQEKPIKKFTGSGFFQLADSKTQFGVSNLSVNDREISSEGAVEIDRDTNQPRVDAHLLLKHITVGKFSGLSQWISRYGLTENNLIYGTIDELALQAKGPLRNPNVEANFQVDRLTLNSDDRLIKPATPLIGEIRRPSVSDSISVDVGPTSKTDRNVVPENSPLKLVEKFSPIVPVQIDTGMIRITGRLEFSGKVNLNEGSGFSPDDVQGTVVSNLTGMLYGEPFKIEGQIPVPNPFQSNLNTKGFFKRINLAELHSVVGLIVPISNFTVDGEASVESFHVRGTPTTVKLSLETTMDQVNLKTPALPQSLFDFRGTMEVKGEITDPYDNRSGWLDEKLLFTGDLNGNIGLHPVSVSGTVPLKGWPDDSLNLRGQIGLSQLKMIQELLPGDPIPESIKAHGPISIPRIRLSGSIVRPDVDASIEAHGVSVTVPYLESPISSIHGTVHYTPDRIRVENARGKFQDRSLLMDGRLWYESDRWKTELNLRTDTFPLSVLVDSVDKMPSFGEGWQPEGSVRIKAEVTDGLSNPKISGHFYFSRLAYGNLGVSRLAGNFHYDHGQIRLRPSDGQISEGKFKGKARNISFPLTSRLSLDATIRNNQLKGLKASFRGLEYASKGRLNGEIELSGESRGYTRMTGDVTVNGRNLNFRDVPALRQLSIVLNTSLTRAIESSVFDSILNIITLDFREGTRSASTLLSSKLTTRFDKAHADVEFNEGKGKIDSFRLSNSELDLIVDGFIWLDGRIRVTVTLKPKTPILNQVEKRWLRGFLSGGFPDFKVKGTINDPKFNLKGLQKGIQGRIQRLVYKILTFGLFD